MKLLCFCFCGVKCWKFVILSTNLSEARLRARGGFCLDYVLLRESFPMHVYSLKAPFSHTPNFFSNLIIAILHSLKFISTSLLSLLVSSNFTHSIPFTPTKHNCNIHNLASNCSFLNVLHYQADLLSSHPSKRTSFRGS